MSEEKLSPDELMNLFGLKERPKEVNLVAEIHDCKDYEAEFEEVPNALILDLWDKAKGEEMHVEIPNYGESDLADMFGICFQANPKPNEDCTDKTKLEYIKKLLETPETKALREDTIRNVSMSKIAATRLMQELANLRNREMGEKAAETARKPQISDKSSKAQAKEKAALETQKELKLLNAVSKITQDAQKEINEIEEIALAISCSGAGTEPGSDENKIDAKKIAPIHHRVKNNAFLRKVFEYSGRYIRCAMGIQREKCIHGYDDMVGIEPTKDPSKLLSSELARLTDPELEVETLLRLTERQTLGRKHIGYEKVGRGPVVLQLDESASMESGDAIYHAKGIATALAWIAKFQKRWCILVGFSAGFNGNTLILKPGQWDESKFCDWLQHFYDGGTTYHVPFNMTPIRDWPEFVKQGLPKGKVDMIVISDGEIVIPYQVVNEFNEWKKREKVRAIGLMVGYESPGMDKVLDESHSMSRLDVNDKAIKQIFSI